VTAGEARGVATCVPARVVLVGPSYAWEPGGDVCPSAGHAACEPNTLWQCVIGPRPNRSRRMNPPYRVYRVTS
jgi:hypothetical protein